MFEPICIVVQAPALSARHHPDAQKAPSTALHQAPFHSPRHPCPLIANPPTSTHPSPRPVRERPPPPPPSLPSQTSPRRISPFRPPRSRASWSTPNPPPLRRGSPRCRSKPNTSPGRIAGHWPSCPPADNLWSPTSQILGEWGIVGSYIAASDYWW